MSSISRHSNLKKSKSWSSPRSESLFPKGPACDRFSIYQKLRILNDASTQLNYLEHMFQELDRKKDSSLIFQLVCECFHPHGSEFLFSSMIDDSEAFFYPIQSPLHVAVYLNSHIVVRQILKLKEIGFDFFAYSPIRGEIFKNYSPLDIAVDKKNLPMVKILLEEGRENLNPCIPKHHLTPLHLAAKNNDFHSLKYLVENGASLRTHSIQSPRHILNYAFSQCSEDIVDYLLTKFTDKELLYYSVENDKKIVLQSLVDTGVDLTLIEPTTGHSLLDKAIHTENYGAFLFLLNYMDKDFLLSQTYKYNDIKTFKYADEILVTIRFIRHINQFLMQSGNLDPLIKNKDQADSILENMSDEQRGLFFRRYAVSI